MPIKSNPRGHRSTQPISKPKYKLIFVGDENVGKTSIITRYVNSAFNAAYDATIGIDFLTKEVFKNDTRVKLQLWDTAGQERFHSLIPSYIRKAHVICYIFDVCNVKSYDHMSFWLSETKENCSDWDEITTVLIANKIDLSKDRKISVQACEKIMNELQIDCFFEVSAKTGFNIDLLFSEIINRLPTITPIKAKVKLEKPVEFEEPQKKKGCC